MLFLDARGLGKKFSFHRLGGIGFGVIAAALAFGAHIVISVVGGEFEIVRRDSIVGDTLIGFDVVIDDDVASGRTRTGLRILVPDTGRPCVQILLTQTMWDIWTQGMTIFNVHTWFDQIQAGCSPLRGVQVGLVWFNGGNAMGNSCDQISTLR
mmetsp:Transcript_10445/g.21635  ORF Transcript_10445/g.21635 Transcript_10445/m.21635 type:complete len:153 (+) Transcript_10445:1149-1607(+)